MNVGADDRESMLKALDLVAAAFQESRQLADEHQRPDGARSLSRIADDCGTPYISRLYFVLQSVGPFYPRHCYGAGGHQHDVDPPTQDRAGRPFLRKRGTEVLGVRSDMARDIRILVIGKANLVRDGLWALLRAQEGMEVLTVIENDVEAIKSVVVRPIPDVAVMHFPLMTPSGLDAVAAVRRRWPAGRVIALTPRLDDRVVSTATEATAVAAYAIAHGHLIL